MLGSDIAFQTDAILSLSRSLSRQPPSSQKTENSETVQVVLKVRHRRGGEFFEIRTVCTYICWQMTMTTGFDLNEKFFSRLFKRLF